MKVLVEYLSVAGAGALGAVARLLVGRTFGQLWNWFPLGTFIVNITGSLFLGWFVTFAGSRAGISETARLAIAVGFVGAYTTFSTYMAESNSLYDNGMGMKAMAYLLGSLVVGLAAVRAGIWLGGR